MPVTTASQFGRRGADPGRAAARPNLAGSGAATAFEAATRWNRTQPEPTLASLAPLPAQDNWVPTSDTATKPTVAPSPGLFALLFSMKGRVGLRDYWLVGVFAWLIFVLGLVVLFIDLPLMKAACGAAVLVLVYSHITTALAAKRWHDRGKSAVWAWVVFVPFVGWAWALIECGFLPGTPGDNRYGPPPK